MAEYDSGKYGRVVFSEETGLPVSVERARLSRDIEFPMEDIILNGVGRMRILGNFLRVVQRILTVSPVDDFDGKRYRHSQEGGDFVG